MTIELRRVTAEDWATWRPIRLAALPDAPDAFGSSPDDRAAQETYARTGFTVTDEPGDLLPDGRRGLVVRRDLEERP